MFTGAQLLLAMPTHQPIYGSEQPTHNHQGSDYQCTVHSRQSSALNCRRTNPVLTGQFLALEAQRKNLKGQTTQSLARNRHMLHTSGPICLGVRSQFINQPWPTKPLNG